MERHIEQFVNFNVLDRIVMGYEAQPQNVLGPHKVGDGYVITAYHPHACGMTVRMDGDMEDREMERIHEGGVYSIYIKTNKYLEYKITMYFEGGGKRVSEDPYRFPSSQGSPCKPCRPYCQGSR